jgi:hypothetical protein
MNEATGRRVATMDDMTQAGDYCGPETVIYEDGPYEQVWFLLPIHQGTDKFDHATPGSGLHGITSPPWSFTEQPDGSLAVGGSIACGRGTKDGEYFHGWLNAGHRWVW